MSSTSPKEADTTAKTSPEKPHPTPPPNAKDVESQNQTPPPAYSVVGIFRRWRHEDISKKGSFGLRSSALLFSLLAFIIMASNKHGDWRNYDKYEEFRYELAIAILSSIYTGFQVWRQYRLISTGKELLSFSDQNLALIDFVGDQIMAYLLISAASSAVPMTNRMREGADNAFTDSLAASISMEFFAFFILGLSAILSGYKLVKSSCI
ncbi:hypothetical protein L6452_36957 [Arctium lappa]|uniref:Uncharacterized protein n=1 Tax=Arctium lappa TaxID=4217 RepID=A0ACB8Y1M2_ARCLA|nr:hypothetical protein L6452_36957 [Arctium lappa]